MKNKYRIEGDKCYIALLHGLETIIDATDFDLVNAYKGTWSARWSPCTKSYYCTHQEYIRPGKHTATQLSRALLRTIDRNVHVDHQDHNTLNNTKENLRAGTRAENAHNQIKPQAVNTTGYMGVFFYKQTGRFTSQIGFYGRNIHLGYFNTALEAAYAYRNAKVKYHNIILPEPIEIGTEVTHARSIRHRVSASATPVS